MRAINQVRAAGSIEAAVPSGLIGTGIMHALVTPQVPFVLAGSIRDDGPLPGVVIRASWTRRTPCGSTPSRRPAPS